MIRRSLESVSVARTGSMLRGISEAIESVVSAAIGLLARTDEERSRESFFPLLVNLLFSSFHVANWISYQSIASLSWWGRNILKDGSLPLEMPSLLIERGMAQLAGRPFLFYTQSQHRVFLVVGSIVPLLNTRLCSSAAKSSYINAASTASTHSSPPFPKLLRKGRKTANMIILFNFALKSTIGGEINEEMEYI